MDERIRFAPQNETMVETTRFVGVYVGESNHSGVLNGALHGFRNYPQYHRQVILTHRQC